MAEKTQKHIPDRWWKRKLDNKRRLIIPAPLRKLLKGKLILRAGSSGKVYLYNKKDDKEVLEKWPHLVKDLAVETSLDGHGRVMLPDTFVVFIGLGAPDAENCQVFELCQTTSIGVIPAVLIWSELGKQISVTRNQSAAKWGSEGLSLYDGESISTRQKLMRFMAGCLAFSTKAEASLLESNFAAYLRNRIKNASMKELVKRKNAAMGQFQRMDKCRDLFLVFLLGNRLQNAKDVLRRLRQLDDEVFCLSCEGVLNFQLRAFQASARAFTEQVKQNKLHVLAKYCLGIAKLAQGDSDEALSCLRDAALARPEFLHVLLTAENTAVVKGWVEGVAHFAVSTELYIGRSPLGPEALKDDWISKQAYIQANSKVRSAPKSTEAHFDLGRFFLEHQLFDQAIEELQTARLLQPENDEILTCLLTALLGCQKPDEVVRLLRPFGEMGGERRGVAYALALALAETGAAREACDLLKQSFTTACTGGQICLPCLEVSVPVFRTSEYGTRNKEELIIEQQTEHLLERMRSCFRSI